MKKYKVIVNDYSIRINDELYELAYGSIVGKLQKLKHNNTFETETVEYFVNRFPFDFKKVKNKITILEVYNKITCNESREMTFERFKKAVKELKDK